MKIIALDIGNTNTKLQIDQDAVLVLNNAAIFAHTQPLDFTLTEPCQIHCSSVIQDPATALILDYVQQRLTQVTTIKRWYSSQILQLALPQQYSKLTHLGSDRALRIYALSQLDHEQPQLGIGCGSAFTIEIVYRQQLIVSLILPGLTMQLNSLSSNTAKLPQLDASSIATVLATAQPLTTEHAIAAGIIGSYCALIESLQQRYAPQQSICSGAYAPLIGNSVDNSKLNLSLKLHLETAVLQHLAQRHTLSNA